MTEYLLYSQQQLTIKRGQDWWSSPLRPVHQTPCRRPVLSVGNLSARHGYSVLQHHSVNWNASPFGMPSPLAGFVGKQSQNVVWRKSKENKSWWRWPCDGPCGPLFGKKARSVNIDSVSESSLGPAWGKIQWQGFATAQCQGTALDV